MIPPTVLVGGVVVAFLAGAAASHKVTSDHYIAAEAKKLEEGGAKVNQASAKLEGKKNDIKVVYRTVTRNVQTTVDRPFYRDDCFDDRGLRDADAALARGSYTRKPDPAMPEPDADGRENPIRRFAEDR